MTRWKWLTGGAIALSATLAFAQDAPESLLPPGFDDPVPSPTPTATAAAAPQAPGVPPVNGEPRTPDLPTVPQAPGTFGPGPDLSQFDFTSIPTIEELEEMTG